MYRRISEGGSKKEKANLSLPSLNTSLHPLSPTGGMSVMSYCIFIKSRTLWSSVTEAVLRPCKRTGILFNTWTTKVSLLPLPVSRSSHPSSLTSHRLCTDVSREWNHKGVRTATLFYSRGTVTIPLHSSRSRSKHPSTLGKERPFTNLS